MKVFRLVQFLIGCLIMALASCHGQKFEPVAAQTKLIDMNGDGQPDRVSMDSQNRIWVEIAKEGGFQEPTIWWTPDRTVLPEFWLADVTGDGKPDLIVRAEGGLRVAPGALNRFNPATEWLHELPPLSSEGIRFEDVDGDGKFDLILRGLDGEGNSYTSSGQRFEPRHTKRKP
ncbi:MAG TPA: VCBS repeat-containing protein [Leptospiraceae bacterium]|nr:VCBS repeat-containing protein [Leptospiraceae bacterium]HNE25269.1 VCBS repeat-containing protein [Leptospiraceae bacterium]